MISFFSRVVSFLFFFYSFALSKKDYQLLVKRSTFSFFALRKVFTCFSRKFGPLEQHKSLKRLGKMFKERKNSSVGLVFKVLLMTQGLYRFSCCRWCGEDKARLFQLMFIRPPVRQIFWPFIFLPFFPVFVAEDSSLMVDLSKAWANRSPMLALGGGGT